MMGSIRQGRTRGRGEQRGAEGDSQSVPHRTRMVNVFPQAHIGGH